MSLTNFEIVALEPAVAGEAGIYESTVETDADMAERFMRRHSVKLLKLRSYPRHTEPVAYWTIFQWHFDQPAPIGTYIDDPQVSTPGGAEHELTDVLTQAAAE